MPRSKDRPRTRQEVEALTLRLPSDMYQAVKAVAFATDRTVTDVIRDSVTSYLSDEGRRQEFQALLDASRSRYRLALDKLADL